jgi:ADP-heptose:LPS heptosyltransferase
MNGPDSKLVSSRPPAVVQSRYSWHASSWLLPRLGVLQRLGGWLTLWDSFGTPGDTILTAIVARIIRERYPRLRINCITPNPELLRWDPHIDQLNGPAGLILLRFWYLGLIDRKESEQNLLAETMQKVSISSYDYRAEVYLLPKERLEAKNFLETRVNPNLPVLGFNSVSRESVKCWGRERWQDLLRMLAEKWNLVQLGDDQEPEFPGVIRCAGTMSMRESMSVLSQCDVFAGPDSFLMHAAAGLNVPSVIIFGGARPVKCVGYAENVNLTTEMPCAPCWLHSSRGDVCPYNVACMKEISALQVREAVEEQLSRSGAKPVRSFEN